MKKLSPNDHHHVYHDVLSRQRHRDMPYPMMMESYQQLIMELFEDSDSDSDDDGNMMHLFLVYVICYCMILQSNLANPNSPVPSPIRISEVRSTKTRSLEVQTSPWTLRPLVHLLTSLYVVFATLREGLH